jgi:hypothetical protein
VSNSISAFLERKLKVLNAENFIKVTDADDYISNVRNAVLRANNLRERVSIEIDGVELTQDQLGKVKIAMPDAFQAKPVTYESFAADGSSFAIEIN